MTLTTGCKKKEDPYLKVSPAGKEYSFTQSAKDQSFLFSVSTNQPIWDVSSDQEWCVVKKSGTVFKVTASSNDGFTPREKAKVTVRGGVNVQDIVITFSQDGKEATLGVGPNTDPVNFPAYSEGEEFSFTVTTNESSWKAISDKTWCTVTKNGTKGFKITAASNRGISSPEAATVTISTANTTPVTITVTQDAARATLTSSTDSAAFTRGEGTEEVPFLITSGAELLSLIEKTGGLNGNAANDHSGIYFRLATNIEVTLPEWTPVGIPGAPFKGNFDGYGYTVSGNMSSSSYNNFGFFGEVADASIENLIVSSNLVNAYNGSQSCYTGGIVGYAGAVTISKCIFKGSVTGGKINSTGTPFNCTGGIIGGSTAGLIVNSTNEASVTGGECLCSKKYAYTYAGGIAGMLNNGSINYCTNSGNVQGGKVQTTYSSTATYCSTGGIAGFGLNIYQCTNDGEVRGGDGDNLNITGGLAGEQNLKGAIETSVNNGAVYGGTTGVTIYTAGLVGSKRNVNAGVFDCCVNNGTVDGAPASAANNIGDGSALNSCTREDHKQ